MNNISNEEWEPVDSYAFTGSLDAATLVMQMMNEHYPVAAQREGGKWMVYTKTKFAAEVRERFCDE